MITAEKLRRLLKSLGYERRPEWPGFERWSHPKKTASGVSFQNRDSWNCRDSWRDDTWWESVYVKAIQDLAREENIDLVRYAAQTWVSSVKDSDGQK